MILPPTPCEWIFLGGGATWPCSRRVVLHALAAEQLIVFLPNGLHGGLVRLLVEGDGDQRRQVVRVQVGVGEWEALASVCASVRVRAGGVVDAATNM